MPLGARRLVLIGGLLIPLDLVAGPYLYGLQLLAVAGPAAVAIRLSYQRGPSWFSLWSSLTAVTGGSWLAATAVYWLSILAASNGTVSTADLSSDLFAAASGALLFTAAAILVRYRHGPGWKSPWSIPAANLHPSRLFLSSVLCRSGRLPGDGGCHGRGWCRTVSVLMPTPMAERPGHQRAGSPAKSRPLPRRKAPTENSGSGPATADGILASTDGGETFRDSDPK